jgi:hypothetical protein
MTASEILQQGASSGHHLILENAFRMAWQDLQTHLEADVSAQQERLANTIVVLAKAQPYLNANELKVIALQFAHDRYADDECTI